VNNLIGFAEKNALPSCISLEQMKDGSGILSTLISSSAKYHTICRNKYDGQKLSRLSASAVVSSDPVEQCSSVSTRSTSGSVDIKSSCLFCESGSFPGKNC
jgi:hypothetical protein